MSSAFKLEQSLEKYMVLFSVHNIDLVTNFCDIVLFIDKQRNVFQSENPRDFQKLECVFFQECV